MNAKGFLVVERKPAVVEASLNKLYKGLYRTPPFSQDAFDKGFDDPYLTERYVDSVGLIPTAHDAIEVLTRFAKVVPEEELEIIYAEETDGSDQTVLTNHLKFLGFDIAAYSPFWSILLDLPGDPDKSRVSQRILSQTNEFGLLPTQVLAERVLAEYGGEVPENKDLLGIWKVSQWSRGR